MNEKRFRTSCLTRSRWLRLVCRSCFYATHRRRCCECETEMARRRTRLRPSVSWRCAIDMSTCNYWRQRRCYAIVFLLSPHSFVSFCFSRELKIITTTSFSCNVLRESFFHQQQLSNFFRFYFVLCDAARFLMLHICYANKCMKILMSLAPRIARKRDAVLGAHQHLPSPTTTASTNINSKAFHSKWNFCVP